MLTSPFASPDQIGDVETGTTLAPKFDANGLVTAVVQHAQTLQILMLAHMNAEALGQTIETGKACFWSRSRKKLWMKGETSGEVLKVTEIVIDCDQDALVVKAIPEGRGAACHTGRVSCFYRKLDTSAGNAGNTSLITIDDSPLFDPDKVY